MPKIAAERRKAIVAQLPTIRNAQALKKMLSEYAATLPKVKGQAKKLILEDLCERRTELVVCAGEGKQMATVKNTAVICYMLAPSLATNLAFITFLKAYDIQIGDIERALHHSSVDFAGLWYQLANLPIEKKHIDHDTFSFEQGGSLSEFFGDPQRCSVLFYQHVIEKGDYDDLNAIADQDPKSSRLMRHRAAVEWIHTNGFVNSSVFLLELLWRERFIKNSQFPPEFISAMDEMCLQAAKALLKLQPADLQALQKYKLNYLGHAVFLLLVLKQGHQQEIAALRLFVQSIFTQNLLENSHQKFKLTDAERAKVRIIKICTLSMLALAQAEEGQDNLAGIVDIDLLFKQIIPTLLNNDHFSYIDDLAARLFLRVLSGRESYFMSLPRASRFILKSTTLQEVIRLGVVARFASDFDNLRCIKKTYADYPERMREYRDRRIGRMEAFVSVFFTIFQMYESSFEVAEAFVALLFHLEHYYPADLDNLLAGKDIFPSVYRFLCAMKPEVIESLRISFGLYQVLMNAMRKHSKELYKLKLSDFGLAQSSSVPLVKRVVVILQSSCPDLWSLKSLEATPAPFRGDRLDGFKQHKDNACNEHVSFIHAVLPPLPISTLWNDKSWARLLDLGGFVVNIIIAMASAGDRFEKLVQGQQQHKGSKHADKAIQGAYDQVSVWFVEYWELLLNAASIWLPSSAEGGQQASSKPDKVRILLADIAKYHQRYYGCKRPGDPRLLELLQGSINDLVTYIFSAIIRRVIKKIVSRQKKALWTIIHKAYAYISQIMLDEEFCRSDMPVRFFGVTALAFYGPNAEDLKGFRVVMSQMPPQQQSDLLYMIRRQMCQWPHRAVLGGLLSTATPLYIRGINQKYWQMAARWLILWGIGMAKKPGSFNVSIPPELIEYVFEYLVSPSALELPKLARVIGYRGWRSFGNVAPSLPASAQSPSRTGGGGSKGSGFSGAQVVRSAAWVDAYLQTISHLLGGASLAASDGPPDAKRRKQAHGKSRSASLFASGVSPGQRVAQSFKMNFVPQNPDGNCFYRVMAAGVKSIPVVADQIVDAFADCSSIENITHTHMRRLAVGALALFFQRGDTFGLSPEEQQTKLTDHSGDGVWADDYMIGPLTAALGITLITVRSEKTEQGGRMVSVHGGDAGVIVAYYREAGVGGKGMHFDLLEGGLDLLIRRKVQQCQQTGAPPADVTISQAGARYQAIAAAAPVAAVSAAGR